MDKKANNDQQNITQITIDRATQTPQKAGVNAGSPEGFAVPAPHVTSVELLVTVKQHEYHLKWNRVVDVNKYK